MLRFSRLLPATLAIAGGLILGEAAVRPSQEAQADNWEFYFTPQGAWCEGCCSGGTVLCCSSANKCRIEIT